MLIDWFTVIAQIINFLILVWLLKRYLYNPILKVLDEREKKVATQLKDAESAKTQALEEKEEFQRKNDEFDKERKTLFSKISEEAADEHNRLFDEARKELESFRLKQLESLKNEYRYLNQEILLKTQQEVFAIVRKTLSDLANKKLEDSIVEVFIRQLHNMEGKEKESLLLIIESFRKIQIKSVFELLDVQQSAIKHAMKEKFAIEPEITFEIVPELVSGIELVSDGYKVAWSIADYIFALEKNVGSLIEEKIKILIEKGS